MARRRLRFSLSSHPQVRPRTLLPKQECGARRHVWAHACLAKSSGRGASYHARTHKTPRNVTLPETSHADTRDEASLPETSLADTRDEVTLPETSLADTRDESNQGASKDIGCTRLRKEVAIPRGN